ncbi:MFS transporter [Rossellomorea arthrocnemi]
MSTILRNHNFLFLFLGRLITNIGDSIYAIATIWLVYDLTKDPLFTGIATALVMIPGAFTFLIGPLVDRWSLRKILVRTQLIEFTLISIIPISYFLGFLNVWIILVIMPLAAFVEQFVYPAQQAALPKILGKDQLVQGNSLMSMAYQGTDLIFMGLSGVLIIIFGAMNLFIIDAITFVIAAGLFRMILISKDSQHGEMTKAKYKQELVEGFQVVKGSFISKFLILIIFANFIYGAINAILPAYADYRGNSAYFGLYLASLTTGILLGSLGASLLKRLPIGKTVIIGATLSSILWIFSSLAENYIISLILFGLSFIPIGYLNVTIFTILQISISEELIGRVFSFIGSITVLSMPLGAVIGGAVAKWIGAENVFIMGATGNILIAMFWLFTPNLRRYSSIIKNQEKIDSTDVEASLL